MPDPFVKIEIHEKQVMPKGLLQRLADKIRKEHPKLDNVRLLHDNERPHIAKKTSQKILELGWEVLLHPPYSPNLAPSDYHFFRLLQHRLEEKRYDDRDHLENDLRAFFASKSPAFDAKGIRDLVRRRRRLSMLMEIISSNNKMSKSRMPTKDRSSREIFSRNTLKRVWDSALSPIPSGRPPSPTKSGCDSTYPQSPIMIYGVGDLGSADDGDGKA
ncbi:hypothetical protein RB195_007697 [Necator americanus]|uniref:Tc1-like transposase DDE domain-containing protein n=1 Tax=Necator americanus TaxID=51031 RepID=A0ABR1BYG6_NECAM